ncbi:MAG: AAA family ATPase, partial [Planctomycetes bacterium]|nr:AAA family ATPase [Planctomycetota bacterium]
MGLSTSIHDLKTLVLSYHPVIAIESVEEDRVRDLLGAVARDLDMALFEWSVTRGLVQAAKASTIGETFQPLDLLKHIETLTVRGIFLLKDLAWHLGDPEVTRQLRETAQGFSRTRSTMVLTGAEVKLPGEVRHKAVFYDLKLPEREELQRVVRAVVASLQRDGRVKVILRAQDLEELLRALRGMTLNQARQAVAYAALEDGRLSPKDVQAVLSRKVQLIREGGLLEYYPVEDNRYELGGFERLKAWLERARVGFSAEAQALNLSAPKGILIVGVQGCGKSLAAKAIAREWSLPLLKLDAGRLFDKYIGESEKNFRKAIWLAESMVPVVLWIDEIEKAMAVTGSGEADAGLSRRLFGAFLTWLQEKRKEVFVVATANDLSVVPPELLRKGRFDEVFFVDLPDAREREEVFRIHLGLRKQDPARLDLAALVAATDGFSGAEIEQAVIGSLYR